MSSYQKFLVELQRVPRWVFTLVTLLVILWLTLAPRPLGDNSPRLFPGADKVVHGIMFGFFTIMMLLDLQRSHHWERTPLFVALICAAISSALGISIEFIQLKMDIGRGFEIADMIADTVGSFTFAITWVYFQKFWLPKTTNK